MLLSEELGLIVTVTLRSSNVTSTRSATNESNTVATSATTVTIIILFPR